MNHKTISKLIPIVVIFLFLFSAVVGEVSAAGTSRITSVYFRTHYYNSGLYVEITATCSYRTIIWYDGDNDGYYDVLKSRGALNGRWTVQLPTLAAGRNHRLYIECERALDTSISWWYNVYYKNGSLNGTYRLGILTSP